LASMALIGRHEPDAAVAVLVVVPIHKCRHPGAGLLDALEWPAGVVRPQPSGSFWEACTTSPCNRQALRHL
jgi:hypothetical protein